MKVFLSILISLLATACSPFGFLGNAIDADKITTITDIKYGDNPRQKMDVYVPKNLQKPTPVVIFIYGGSWDSGKKSDYAFVAKTLAEQGFITAIPDYRLYPEVRFPDFLDDVAAATAMVMRGQEILDLGGDKSKIFVMGHSAGAYNAAMLAYDEKYLKKHGANNKKLAGFIGLAGPYDFFPYDDERTIKIFDKFSAAQTQPVLKINAGEPKALLLHGTEDDQVFIRNSRNMDETLKAKQVQSELVELPEIGHIKIITGLSPTLFNAEIVEKISNFIAN